MQLESISKNLLSQMLEVLGTNYGLNGLMYISSEEFEKCEEVFSCWDVGYERLQCLMREDHIKMMRREKSHKLPHKRLQERLQRLDRAVEIMKETAEE